MKAVSSLENSTLSAFTASHIFPDLEYKNTTFIYSDPQITIYHDYGFQNPIPGFQIVFIFSGILVIILLYIKDHNGE
ncbi:MAG: hypothetical protein GF329_04770 [Candidatus Lokiarchaeota archaeon]|nr:hypothetical protein [Candidatus Lokiarchaeota archaeon]